MDLDRMQKDLSLGSIAQEILMSFETRIKETVEEIALLKKRLEGFSGTLDRISDPFKGDQNEEALISTVRELNHFDKKLKILIKRREEFLEDPFMYQRCRGCGEKIPKERIIEVPQTRWCVSCKNKYNGGR